MSATPTSADASPDDNRFAKRFEFEKADDNEQIAYGAVMVPDRLDHQADFVRPETISSLRDDFEKRVDDGDAYGGVMHAVFPSDDVELVEDRQLESSESIGGKELPAGTWVQGWKFTDDDLWELVKDGVLGGNSIGGTAKGVIYEPGAMPDDVEIPDAVQSELDEAGLSRDDIIVREITEGRIMEVSAVDYPAVPDATHEEHKSLATAKASTALTDNVVAARLYLEARGHDPDEARRLAEYLNDQKSQKGLFGRLREKWLGGSGSEQSVDERAESRAGSDNEDLLTSMNEDELNEKLDALDSRLSEIDEKLSADTDSDGDTEERQESKADDGDDGPTTEEKLDTLAEATKTTVDQVEQIADQVEQMADAQGVSQQADQGSGGEEKLWGENSPFGGDN